jgi:soluble lytic murein transglycosylase
VRLAIRAQGRGAGSDRVLVRLLYPMPFANLLASEANRQGLDPMLVASIIRQESAFDPRARSGADARGLMQVLPSVGRQLALRLGIRGFEPILLYQPEVNLRMGTVHLAASLREYSRLVHALAAYNAGGTRVKRWLETAGTEDPEWFVERIPIPETRDYVRRILVNLARYKAIHSDE